MSYAKLQQGYIADSHLADTQEYFRQLGYTDNDQIALRVLGGKGYKQSALPNMTYLLKDLPLALLRAQNNLNNHRSVYALPNGGHDLASTTSVRAIAFEWDDIPKDKQWLKVEELGLKDFISMVVDTGRKSLHFYIILDKPVEPEQGVKLAKDVAAYCKSDLSVAKACQPMRLPGFYHHQKDLEPKLSLIVHNSGIRTSYDKLREFIPVVTVSSSVSRKSSAKVTSKGISLDELIEKVDASRPEALNTAQQTKVLAEAYEVVANAKEGGRDNILWLTGCNLARKHLLRGLDVTEAFNTLLKGAEACGLGDMSGSILRALDTGFEAAIEYRDRSDNILEQYNITQPDRTITQRYVQELPLDGKPHLLLKSQKGTGKTRALKAFIEKMQASRVPVLSIGHRCTLLNEQAAKLSLNYYEDLGGKYEEQRNLAVTLDSLHKVPLWHWKDAVIVFDEASQVLKHLMGDTAVKKTRRLCVEAIMFLCSHAKHIVALDADLSQTEVDFFARIVGRDNINVVVNTQQPTSRKFIQYPDVASLLKQMLAALDRGENLYFFSNSKAKVETIERMLKKERPGKTILAVSSDNSKTADIQLFMRNINQEVHKYQAVLASPSLGTGVDIETSHFHSVFALITKGDQNSASDIMQGIARVRNPIAGEVHLYAEAGINTVELDPEVIQNQVSYLTEPNSYQLDMIYGKRVPINAEAHELYESLYCAKTAQHNASVANLKESLLKLIQAEGHSLMMLQDSLSKPEAKETLCKFHTAKEEVKQAKTEMILVATSINESEVEELAKRPSKTVEQQASLAKYWLMRHCGLEPEQVTTDWIEWYQGNGKQAIKNYIGQFVLPRAALHEYDTADRLDKGMFQADQGRRYATVELRQKLIPEAVLQGQVVNHEWLVELGYVQLLEANKEAIATLLGIKTRVDKPMQTLSAALKQIGLELGYCEQQSRSLYKEVDGFVVPKKVRTRTYQLLVESQERMEGIAQRTWGRWLDKLVGHLQETYPHLKTQQLPTDPKLAAELKHKLAVELECRFDIADELYDELYEQWLFNP